MFSSSTVQMQNLITSITAGMTIPQGESNATSELSVVNTFTNGVNKITMPTLSNNILPSGWRIYRGTSPGSETYLTTVAGDETVFYDDGTFVGTLTTPPSAHYGYLGSVPTNIGAITLSNPGTAYMDLAFAGTTTPVSVAYDTWCYAQPFIAHSSNLDSIDLPIDYHGNPTNITVSIYPEVYSLVNSTQNLIPNTYNSSGATTPLGTVTLTLSQVNQFGVSGLYTHFPFPTPVSLTKGQMYYIVVSAPTAANTNGSGNYWSWYGSFNGTALTTCLNRVVYGYGYQVFSANGNSNNNGSQAWINTATGGLGYKINGQGTLAAGTYYYVITASTGFAPKSSFSGYDSAGLAKGQIYFCAGDGTDRFYPALATSGNNNALTCGLFEKYGIQTHLVMQYFSSTPTNGQAITNQSYVYNSQLVPIYVNSNAISASSNGTFRLHTYTNYFYLDVAGDSANSGFQECIVFVGMPTALGAGDKPYVVSGNANTWHELRDYNNAVNQSVYPLLVTNSYVLFQGNDTDVVTYYNSYTGNNDGITMTLADPNGVRATLPNLILIPKGSSSSINNHDTFVVNGQTYIVYQTFNYSGQSATYKPFSIWSFGTGGNYGTDYYPAIQIS